ncbi:MAG: UDP-N-acetylglucosamine 1-carboxyvinyltransferase [Clostridia bacterium]|nr:UDP-N-acetylglucosamine 1-carboxyvinyltransferase [Clostridia bacterium]
MKKILVRGGKPLYGNINISGMKNAALPIVFASILVGERCIVENLPAVSDVELSLNILESMGATVERLGNNTVAIDTTNFINGTSPVEMVSKLRGSTYLLGAELGRFGEARVGSSGGCDFGSRPIDQHIKGFCALGAKFESGDTYNYVKAGPGGLYGTSVYLDIASVGATINVMLAATLAKGKTTIDNAAREPHIVDLANFLNMCGARITGAGTSVIKITGVEKLHGCDYTILPDMIEAGTYMAAVAAVGGRVSMRGVIPKHMETVTAKLLEMGVDVEIYEDIITVSRFVRPGPANVKTYFYPGFPTDMHPQFSALLCVASGVSTVTESVWENRFKYVDELSKMGANISIEGNRATITGIERFKSAAVEASDLRAGAALIIAGLNAEGETSITGVERIERGYDDIVGKLRAIGADIELVEE